MVHGEIGLPAHARREKDDEGPHHQYRRCTSRAWSVSSAAAEYVMVEMPCCVRNEEMSLRD